MEKLGFGNGVSFWDDRVVYISAKVDYAMRALLALAAAPAESPVKGETLAIAQRVPVKFVENTLVELRRAGIVSSQRGPEGGYRLARPADAIAVADVFRALEGPLADVRGERPEETVYEGPAAHLQDVWVAVRAALRLVLESVTLADILAGKLPAPVAELLATPDAWERRPIGPVRP
jgi:Rrf2 family protein